MLAYVVSSKLNCLLAPGACWLPMESKAMFALEALGSSQLSFLSILTA